MVATVNPVDVVIGKTGVVDYKKVTPRNWAQIISASVETLTIDYLRGLKSLRQILNDSGNAVTCPLLCNSNALDSLHSIWGNKTFLHCCDLVALPVKWNYGKSPEDPEDLWLPKTHRQLLLGRDRESFCTFYILETQCRSDDAGDHRVTRIDEARLELVVLEELFESAGSDLARWGVTTLRALHRAQFTTAQDATRRGQTATERSERLMGYIDRLGCSVAVFQ